MMSDASPRPDPETTLILSYVPPARRAAFEALMVLDGRLGSILRNTREPMVGQMRLTWWHEALIRLDSAEPPAEPVLAALAGAVLPVGISGAMLADLIDGWEALLDDPLSEDALGAYAAGRGGRLFALAGRLSGAADTQLTEAGEGWALVDLAANLSDPALAQSARRLAAARLDAGLGRRWSAPVRALGAMAHGARMTLRYPDRPAGHPLRVARLLRHRLTGR